MINLITTPASIDQAKELLNAGADYLLVGEDDYGLRLPASFSRQEITELAKLAHQAGKKIAVAVNAIFHNDRIKTVLDYYRFLESINVDQLYVGDSGAINIWQENNISIPYVYDASVLVTNARQINFWAHHGASEAMLAHEIPYQELEKLVPQLEIPGVIQVFGSTVIHQSGRPLLDNYFEFVKAHQDRSDKDRGLFISAPNKPETHYSIYEDRNGTHIFANNDLDLMPRLNAIEQLGLTNWKLDGLYAGKNYPEIVAVFNEAKQAIESKTFDDDKMAELDQKVQILQPDNRQLDTGFFDIDPKSVK